MAVTKTPTGSTVRLELHVDTVDGNPVFRKRSFTNVKPTASDQDVYDVAVALGSLQEYPVNDVGRIDSASLIEE